MVVDENDATAMSLCVLNENVPGVSSKPAALMIPFAMKPSEGAPLSKAKNSVAMNSNPPPS